LWEKIQEIQSQTEAASQSCPPQPVASEPLNDLRRKIQKVMSDNSMQEVRAKYIEYECRLNKLLIDHQNNQNFAKLLKMPDHSLADRLMANKFWTDIKQSIEHLKTMEKKVFRERGLQFG